MTSSGTVITNDEHVAAPVEPPRRTSVGKVVVASLATGSVAAILLPFVPGFTVDENFATGTVLLGFAVGWALLAFFSTRSTDQPQRWAVVPAAFMALSGLLAFVASDGFLDALDWVWPPSLLLLVVWTYLRARRDLHSRTRRWLLNPVLVVLALASVGGGVETVSRAVEPSIAMRGQLVDVGPYRLHLECTGSGSPTVVLEPGGGASAATLGWIAPAVAQETRVCVYDRAGRGWSDAAATPPDATQIARDLHTLLARAHIPGPYVLAGHSFGGLYVMTYADRFPDEVGGLVLVDSTAPRSSPVSAQGHGYSVIKHFSALVSTTARVGVGRLIAGAGFSDLPPRSRDEARNSAATAEEMSSFVDEFLVANRSESEAGQLTSLGAKPLVVLTATVGNAKGWTQSQDKLATLSTNSVHRSEAGATHDALVSTREHSAAVSRAIHDVVMSLRTGEPLSGG